jgi:hypothetical protein
VKNPGGIWKSRVGEGRDRGSVDGVFYPGRARMRHPAKRILRPRIRMKGAEDARGYWAMTICAVLDME